MQDEAFIVRLLERYAETAWRRGVAADAPDDANDSCVPAEMQVGSVDEDGWVEWRMLPSTLVASDLQSLESQFRVQFPPVFRAYLLARFQLFDQVKSRRYDQQILMTATPARCPLQPISDTLTAWAPLIDAGFIPYAEWGDGWGPMCFDSGSRLADGDCPVVWFDHEPLISLGADESRVRSAVQPLAQPLYETSRDFFLDIFGNA